MLGYLDDLIIVPLGIMLAVRLVPPEVLAEHRETAVRFDRRPSSRVAAVTIIAIWLAVGLIGLSVALGQSFLLMTMSWFRFGL